MTPTEGANMHDPLIREHSLPGGVTATTVTIRDHDGTDTAVQITAPDEPITVSALTDLAAALGTLAGSLA